MEKLNNEQYKKYADYIEKRTGYASAWGRGVKAYAIDLLDELKQAADYEGEALQLNGASFEQFEKMALNGAEDWRAYSWGGCAFIYNSDIAARLCTKSELKKTDNGEKQPNSREQWLDVQARALFQASRLLYKAMRNA